MENPIEALSQSSVPEEWESGCITCNDKTDRRVSRESCKEGLGVWTAERRGVERVDEDVYGRFWGLIV